MQFNERWSPCGSEAIRAQPLEAPMSGAEDICEISRARQVSRPTPASHLLPGGAAWSRRLQNHCQDLQGLLKIRHVARRVEIGKNSQLEGGK